MNRASFLLFLLVLGGCISKPLENYVPRKVSISGVSEAKLTCTRVLGGTFSCGESLQRDVEKCLRSEAGIQIVPESKNTVSVEMKGDNEAPTIPFWANIITLGLIPYAYDADETTTVTIATPTSSTQFRTTQKSKEERGWWYAITNGSMGFPSDMSDR